MFKARTAILALVAICAAGGVHSATAAAAEEAMFNASKTGELKGLQTSAQVIEGKAGTVKCTKDELVPSESKVSATLAETQQVTVKYSGCTAFGLLSATVSNAKLNFSAAGIATLENTITVKLTNCTITIPPQEDLGYVTYNNQSGKIEVEPHIGGVESSGEGSLCSYAKEAAGTYSGNTLVELPSGTVEWSAGPRFRSEKNKYDLQFTVAPKGGSKQQFILEGSLDEQISCSTSSFNHITIPSAVVALTLQPDFNAGKGCVAVIGGVQDSNVSEAPDTCKRLVLSAAKTMDVGKCIFEVTDKTMGGTVCMIEIEAANKLNSAAFTLVGAPMEVEASETVSGLKYKANAPCGTAKASGSAEYDGTLILKSTTTEGIEVR